MAKQKTHFICQSCGAVAPKWSGKCPECGAWNSFLEEIVSDKKNPETSKEYASGVRLKDVSGAETERTTSGIREFDQVLGGGVVKGSVVLLGGEPGIGKSTIMLQIASILSDKGSSVLYASGEESPTQIKLRAGRLGVKNIDFFVLSTTKIEDILNDYEHKKYGYIFIDSIQTVSSGDISSSAGSVAQIRYVTQLFVELAKSKGVTIFLVGQVTKEGSIAGPKLLEHLVDTVLYFEGDYTRGIRILRAVKNRFGSTNEVGLFEMKQQGLVEINSVSLMDRGDFGPGRSTAVTIEGTRPFLVEIQSLVSTSYYNFPKRNANGIDLNRLHMLIAIIEKKVGLPLYQSDIYLNVAGGMRLNDPGCDLGACVAMLSSFKDIPLPFDGAFIGELGLTGEIRSPSSVGIRIQECRKMGIKKLFIPADYEEDIKGIQVTKIKKISEITEFIF